MKNNTRKEVEDNKVEDTRTEKQKKIDALRESLLNPNRAPVQPAASNGPLGMNRIQRDNESKQYENKMGFGTPRLVTVNRLRVMDESQQKSANFLREQALKAKGVFDQPEEKKTGGFQNTSIAKFRESVMHEERQNTHSVGRKDEEPPKKPEAPVPGGLSFFNKLKKTTEEDAKQKLKSKFNFE